MKNFFLIVMVISLPLFHLRPDLLFAGTSPFDMTASVKSPSGLTELCDVASLDDSHYSIKFVPKEMGVHTVSVKHRDMHIPGMYLSPIVISCLL